MSKAKFFRQSGWMMFASVAGGALSWAVHLLSKKIPDAEYGTLVTLLTATMIIPGGPLQIIFTQQTAAALATGRERQVTRMIRRAWAATFVLWLAAAGVVLFFQNDILARWHVTNPAALWALLLVWLASLWAPMFNGLLQGKQNFLWLGWTGILGSVVRFAAAAFITLVLGGYAAGIMTGVFLGGAAAVGVCIWQTRRLWLGPSEPFQWRELLSQVIPLVLGAGAFQFVFSADTMFVEAYFTPEETAFYGAAGTLARALWWGLGPLTAVMFPKIVHSVAKAEKTDLLAVTLACTAVLAVGGALGLWVMGPWMIRLVYKPSYLEVATKVLPWYAGAMVLLSVANVLVSNLLARSQFRVVPWLVVLAGAYAFALTRFHGSLVAVLQTLSVFCLILLAVCAWFTWGEKVQSPKSKV